VQLDELPEEGQPEPGALDFLVGRSDLAEFLEDRFLILGSDPNTMAADAAECCPAPTVISAWAEAQRFHPIKGRWFKSSPGNHSATRIS
jgi:hypothetical protein